MGGFSHEAEAVLFRFKIPSSIIEKEVAVAYFRGGVPKFRKHQWLEYKV